MAHLGPYNASTFTTPTVTTATVPELTTCIIAPPGLSASDYSRFAENLRDAVAGNPGKYLILPAGAEVKQIHPSSAEIVVDIWDASTIRIWCDKQDNSETVERLADAVFIYAPKMNDPAWAMNQRTLRDIGRLCDANGNHFIRPEKRCTLFGLPIVIDNAVPDTDVLLCEIIARTDEKAKPIGAIKCTHCHEYQRPTPSGHCPGCGAGMAGGGR